MVNVLILAGEDHRNNRLGAAVKALVDINGKPMVQYIVEVLKECDLIDQIGVIGPYRELYDLLNGHVDHIIEGNGTIVDNIMKGINYLGEHKSLLICTSDIPMLNAEAVRDFVIKSQNTQAQLCYPIVEQGVNEKRFPGIERTYVTMLDGIFTGGNIFYIFPGIAKKCSSKAEQLIAYRKNAFKMAKVLGWKTLTLFLSKKLTIAQAEKKFSEIFGITAKAIVSDYPELANDVDKPSDLEYMRKQLGMNH